MNHWCAALLLALAATGAPAVEVTRTLTVNGERVEWPDDIEAALALRAAADRPVATRDPLLRPLVKTGAFSGMTLSPDGRHVALLDVHGSRTDVLLIDTDTMQASSVAPFNGFAFLHAGSPLSVAWVGADRMAVGYPDGTDFVDLQGRTTRRTPATWLMQWHDSHGAMTDQALVQRRPDDAKGLARFDIRSGDSANFDISLPGTILHRLADADGNLRAVVLRDAGPLSDKAHATAWYREDNDSPWHRIDERSLVDDEFVPLAIRDGGHLVVQSRNGGDRLAIWDFDARARTWGPQLAGDAGQDVLGAVASIDGTRPTDAITGGLRAAHTWPDPRMARLQAAVDQALPDAVNTLEPQPGRRMLVLSSSDVDPGHWYLFNSETMTLKNIAERLDDVAPAHMQPMRAFDFAAADGLRIPAWLTLPGHPDAPAPLVVLLGGPQSRDRWQWRQDVQVFAAHGYAVFQPQVRGSTGFGRRFEQAGDGHWARATQDDVTAGVRALVAQKIADPARICIVGAGGGGGHAALWALAQSPAFYKCGVSIGGFTDVARLSEGGGDRDSVRFVTRAGSQDGASPLDLADHVDVPVLLVYGKLDRRVPISEGEALRDALRRAHKPVQWLEFEHEGTGLAFAADQSDAYDAMLALFARSIGQGVPPDNALRAPEPAAR